MRLRTKVPVLGVALILAGISHIAAEERREQNPPGGDEFEHLMPHITQSCVVVRETPGIWPYRSFPYGPLGLEVRGAKTPAEADRIRNFFLGAVAGACGIPPDQVTGYFFCGPQCPANRRDHLLGQLPAISSLARDFGDLRAVRLLAAWAPKGELRVNDLFLMQNRAREAVPSRVMGFVPSGDWRSWPSLGAYLQKIDVSEGKVIDLTRRMLEIGLSALIRDPSGIRLVGVGVGDNESGLLFLRPAGSRPRVNAKWPDGRKYTIVEEVVPGVFYYATT